MKLSLQFDSNTPQYVCDSCYSCTSKVAQSLCKIQDRGCCYYYPKFNLVDIQRMSKSNEGKEVLAKILANENTEISSYFIHAKGYFEENSYNEYIKNNLNYNPKIQDDSRMFKACPFVSSGKGCSIPPKFRTPVCNFFICDEIKKSISPTEVLIEYQRYANDYWRYYDWENSNLIALLEEENLSLKKDFENSLNFLEKIDLFDNDLLSLPKLNDILSFS